MLKIAFSGRSAPSANLIAEQNDDIALYRSSFEEVDVNWGRSSANAKLNPDTSNVTNKRVMRELFAQHNVPMPALLDLNEPDEDLSLPVWHYWDYPVVGRPDFHMKGRGYWLCQNPDDVRKALRGTRKKRAATHFMQYLSPEVAPKEFRVHVFNGQSLRISEKEHYAWHQYVTVHSSVPKDVIRSAAKAAVAAVGLDFGAVDVLASADGSQAWVLEVNSAPGLGGTMPELYANAFLRWKEIQE